jgi:hypothetical protein
MWPRRSQHRRLWLPLGIAFFYPQWAAGAASNVVSLEYTADPALGCPGAAELKANVVKQLGYDPFASEGGEQRLRIEIKSVQNRAQAQIEWIDRDQNSEGERRLAADSSDCSALARSLAFAVAVQIQLHGAPTESTSEPTPPPPAPVAVPEPSVPVPAAAAAKTPPDSPPGRREVRLGVGVLARHGLTPGIAPGLRVFGALSREWAGLELSAHATLPSQRQLGDGTGFTANELGVSLAPCLRSSALGACAVGSFSILHVRGHGVDQIGTPSGMTGGVGGRLLVFGPALERLGIVLQGEVLAVLAPKDVLLNQATVWSTAPVVFSAMLDFGAIFP